ncbi:MAG: MFS transporter, partial [Candidatus Margulisbacteria bacterium]|nr:MFS transporter [Candidatus Margulisiibacteriota bacterium]
PFDLWGFIFLSIFLISFLLGVSKGEQEGWTSTYIVTCAILSVVSFILFLWVESLVENKVFDLDLFRYRNFSICMVISAIRSVVLFGGIFLLPLFLQQLMGLDEIQSGLILLPGSLVVAMMLPIVGRLSDKSSPKLMSIFGLICLVIFMYMYRNINVSMSAWDIILPTLVRGVGMSFLMAPIMVLAVNSVPKNKTSMASAMLNIIQQIGGAVGIAALSTILNNRLAFHLNVIGNDMNLNSPALTGAMKNIAAHVHSLGYNQYQSMLASKTIFSKHIYQSAAVSGFQDTFFITTFVIAICILPAFLLPNRTVQIHKKPEHTVME